MKAQFEQRLYKLRQRMADNKHHALLIFSPDNLRYLTNYSGEAAYGIVTTDQVFLITDYRFVEHAREECIDCNIICRDRERQSLGQAIQQVLTAQGLVDTLYEAEHINLHLWSGIQQELGAILCSACTGLVEDLRKIKDEWEIAQIRQAAAIADQALRETLTQLKIGITEREFALELEYRMQKLGSEGLSFPSIVGFGARSALPHCVPSPVALCEGDLIVVDFGAVINGYRSDMTRSFVAGPANTRQRAMYNTVRNAQSAALEHLRDGQPATKISAAASKILQDSEFHAYTSSGLGHGVGLTLHEQPFISPSCQDILRSNYVVTIEPGIYIPGFGGVRIEDDVVITGNGFNYLTHAPKVFELPL